MSDDRFRASSSDVDNEAVPHARLSSWLWRPWYAKLWWGSIPVYWLAIGEPTRPAILETFASSGYIAITHAVFNPIVALIVLGADYFRRAAANGRLIPPTHDLSSGFGRRPGAPSQVFDEFNPRSGPDWIGNRSRD